MTVRGKGKCKVLHLGRDKSSYQDTLKANQLKSSFAKKDLGIFSGEQTDHEPTTQSYCKSSQQHPGLN